MGKSWREKGKRGDRWPRGGKFRWQDGHAYEGELELRPSWEDPDDPDYGRFGGHLVRGRKHKRW